MNKPNLSIALITKDEENNLPALFESLEDLRKNLTLQIVIVDTGSIDGTIPLAEKNGAEVHQTTWENNFAKARNTSIEHAKAPWILWMDADDRLTPAASDWLRNNIEKLEGSHVYSFTISSSLEGGGVNSFSQIRLFPRGKGLKFENPIHESLAESVHQQNMSGIITGCEIIHTGYANSEIVKKKNQRNKKLLTEMVRQGSEKLSVLFSLARTLQVEKNYTEALPLFDKILSLPHSQSQHPDIYTASVLYKGQILGFQNQLQAGIDFMGNYWESCNKNPQYLFELGKLLLVANNKADAGIVFRNCLKLKGFTWTIPTSWEEIYEGAEFLLKKIEGEKEISFTQPPLKPVTNLTQLKKQFSICSILKNEATNIEPLTQNLPLADVEWIAVDTGSTDGTLEALNKAGVKPYTFEWCDDFSKARNYSLTLATRPWILWLDADDRLAPDFWEQLLTLFSQQDSSELKPAAYRCIIKSERDDDTKDYFLQTRIFPNSMGIEFKGTIHEQLGEALKKNQIPIMDTTLSISHEGYFRAEDREKKLQRNFRYLENEIKVHPNDPKVNYEQGNCYFQMHQYEKALDVYLSLLNRLNLSLTSPPPEDNILRFYPILIANTCLELNQTSEAKKWFTLALRWNPEDLSAPYWFGRKALEENNLQEAEKYFREIEAKPLHVSQVASDNLTIRRNSLGFLVVLALQKHPVEVEEITPWLGELRKGGLQQFPLDYHIPERFYTATQNLPELENYYQEYLGVFPQDFTMWENYLEWLMGQKRFTDILNVLETKTNLRGQTGILEAFLGKTLEHLPETNFQNQKPYDIYIQALAKFPEDPTLVVYYTELLNKEKKYRQAFSDLEKLPKLSEELINLQKQLSQKFQS